ncbi:MAG TPA: class I SAM-dependent methyltransferase [Gemmatimonadales bacterium]|jgi:SAM-dependent methyltransferase|nr:class I SAM-dependent methyltransferase [Gemmatimonadales bacterium]
MVGSFPDHFSRVAGGYASYRPRYPEALFSFLARLPARRELAWDCAAGSGQATVGLVPHFDRVIATDASAALLASAPAHPRIAYRVAPAEASGLETGSADLITVAQAAHWFDLAAFYREARRVLAPGGVLALWTYGVYHLDDPGVDRILQYFYHDVVGPYWPPERRLVEDGYRSLAFPFEEITPPEIAMTADWSLPELLGYLGTWSATTRCREATGRDPVQALVPELEALWGPADLVRRVTWPLGLRVGSRP